MQVEDFDDVSRALDEIRNDLDELTNEQRRVHSEHQEEIEDLQQERRTLEGTVSALDEKVRELSDQVTVLERRALNTSAARAELDTCTQDEQSYARSALRLFELAGLRMTKTDRERKSNTIRQAQHSAAQLATAEDELVDAAKTLVNLGNRDPREPAHQQATAAYNKAKQTRERWQSGANNPDWSQRIATLQSELDDDDKTRAKHDAERRSCRADYLKLRRAIQEKLQSAVDSGAILPVWFTTVLGPTPPAQKTEQWVKTAVDVLEYRVIYGVTDQIVALGPEISADSDDALRHSWRHDVANRLTAHRSKRS